MFEQEQSESQTRLYWLWLAESKYRNQKDSLLCQYGSIRTIFEAMVAYEERENVKQKLKDRLFELENQKIGFCCCEEASYPMNLKEIYGAPGWLYYKGKLPSGKHRIAVVGARACTARGGVIAEQFGRDLAEYGVDVISGMALGIDGCALRGALSTGNASYAVLGCGVDVCYPKEHRKLYEQLAEQGGVLSEYAPGTAPLPNFFPRRNRIISGLSDGILVVEARKKSGSLITAELGLDQGRNIYAVPGRPEDQLSAGCHYLIQNGAKLVNTAEDVVADYEFETGLRTGMGRNQKILLEMAEKVVYASLRLEPRHVNQIQQESGVTWSELSDILLHLELKGYAKQIGVGCYIRTLP